MLPLTARPNHESACSIASLPQTIPGKPDWLTAVQIGTVFASEKYTCPNAVGVDIGECQLLHVSQLQCCRVSQDMRVHLLQCVRGCG